MVTIFAGLMGAIVWNLVTWWLGLPSSSSHALIGGLCGAALASAGGDWDVLTWAATDSKGAAAGLWPKVVLPMLTVRRRVGCRSPRRRATPPTGSAVLARRATR